jgi:hypothetical protein
MMYFRPAMLEDGASKDRPVGHGGAPSVLLDLRGEEGRVRAAANLGDEDAGEGLGEVVRAEEVVRVDHGAQRAANAPGAGEGARREEAEDVEEHVVGETDAVPVVATDVHGDDVSGAVTLAVTNLHA